MDNQRVRDQSILLVVLSLCFHTSFCQFTRPDWVFETHSPIYGSIRVHDDFLYFGNEGGELYSLTKSGQVAWMINLEGGVKSTPALSQESLITNTDKGYLYSVKPSTGEISWKKEVGVEKRYDLWDYYLSSPVIDGSYIYLGLGDGTIQCFELASGEEVWTFQTEDVVHATPVIDQSALYVGGFDGKLYKLQKLTGEVLWMFDTKGTESYPKGEIQKAVLLVKDKIYVTCRGNHLYEIDSNTGKELRNYYEEGSWIIATPRLFKNGLVFGTSDSQVVRMVSLDSFEVQWSTPVSMRVYGEVWSGNDQLIFGTMDGKIYQLGLDGSVIGTHQTNQSLEKYPLVYADNGFFRNDILALYTSNMAAAEELLLQLGGFAGDPMVTDGNLIIPSIEGSVFSFPMY